MAFNSDDMPKIPKNYHADRARVVPAEQVTHAPELIKMASEGGRLLEDRPRSNLWKLAGDVRDDSDATGFFAATFVDDDRQTVVIAYRGADQGIDTIGPVKELLVDGELMSLPGLPFSPKGDGPKEQVADAQQWIYEKALGQDQWHPQFDAALDYAKSVRDKYAPLGYDVEVTGYGLGASEAQLAAHTLGLGGAAFEPYGAKNLTDFAGYKAWLSRNGIDTP